MRNVIGLTLCIIIAGCAPNVKFMKYTSEIYTATQEVEVLRAKPVRKNFIELGELSVRLKKTTEENAVLYLTEKAKSIGADAIVILGEASSGSMAVPMGYMYAVVNKRYLKALAIRYK